MEDNIQGQGLVEKTARGICLNFGQGASLCQGSHSVYICAFMYMFIYLNKLFLKCGKYRTLNNETFIISLPKGNFFFSISFKASIALKV